MFLPYRDENPTRRFAAVTFLLIAANVLFFIHQVAGPAGLAESASQYGLIPSELSGGQNLPDSGWISPYLSLLTYMFCHGSVSHLLFNMLFLWIFGNNVEDRMGRPGYALFYAITGVISALAFVAYKPSIDTPLVGASGAVSGILGAYLFLFPTARVYVWMVLFVLRMPALVFLPIWFLLQIFGFMNDTSAETGNVAWISHIAGFLAGVLLFKFFAGRRPD